MPSSQIINELVAAKLPFHAYRSLTEPEKWGVEDGGDEFNIPPGMSKSSAEDVADALNALRTMVDELQKANVAYVEANTGLLSTLEGWRLVPKEPTRMMDYAGHDAFVDASSPRYQGADPQRDIWSAMLAAAPVDARSSIAVTKPASKNDVPGLVPADLEKHFRVDVDGNIWDRATGENVTNFLRKRRDAIISESENQDEKR